MCVCAGVHFTVNLDFFSILLKAMNSNNNKRYCVCREILQNGMYDLPSKIQQIDISNLNFQNRNTYAHLHTKSTILNYLCMCTSAYIHIFDTPFYSFFSEYNLLSI